MSSTASYSPSEETGLLRPSLVTGTCNEGAAYIHTNKTSDASTASCILHAIARTFVCSENTCNSLVSLTRNSTARSFLLSSSIRLRRKSQRLGHTYFNSAHRPLDSTRTRKFLPWHGTGCVQRLELVNLIRGVVEG